MQTGDTITLTVEGVLTEARIVSVSPSHVTLEANGKTYDVDRWAVGLHLSGACRLAVSTVETFPLV